MRLLWLLLLLSFGIGGQCAAASTPADLFPPVSGQPHVSILGASVPTYCAAAILAVLVYYGVVWVLVGKEPRKKTVIPTWDPPEEVSPAAMRYLTRMKGDKKAVSVAITSAVFKGVVKLETDEYGVRTLKHGDVSDSQLSPDERVLVSGFLGYSGSLRLVGSSWALVRKALDDFSQYLDTHTAPGVLEFNTRYVTIGALFSFLMLILSLGHWAKMIWLCLMLLVIVGFGSVITSLPSDIDRVRRYKGSVEDVVSDTAEVPILLCLFFAIVPAAILFVILGVWFAITLAAMIAINVLFYHLLKRYTPQGMDLLAQIQGFKMYLITAEKDELLRAYGSLEAAQLFKNFLPYAIALGVEREWAYRLSQNLDEVMFGGGECSDALLSPSLPCLIVLANLGSAVSRVFKIGMASLGRKKELPRRRRKR